MREDRKIGSADLAHDVPGAKKLLVQRALDEMLQSSPFRTSRQCQHLLRYIVEHSMAGDGQLLRERIIGVEVFGRPADYDQAADPVVRLRASDVRKRIAQFYQSSPEDHKAVRISIPPGSYKAAFSFLEEEEQEAHIAAVPDPEPPSGAQLPLPALKPSSGRTSGRPQLRAWLAAAGAVLLLAAIAGRGLHVRSTESAYGRFWAPVLANPKQALIYVGSNAVFSLSDEYLQTYRASHPVDSLEEMGREFTPKIRPDATLRGRDLLPASNLYVTIGDLAATVNLTSFLDSSGKSYDLRLGGDITAGDLHDRPAILLGGSNNSWTLAMTSGYRYAFAYQHQIVDRTDKQHVWHVAPDFSEDYAIITRVPYSRTGDALVTAAGIGQVGTRAAAEFLTNSSRMEAALRELPQGWEKKNLELVLHIGVINGAPGQPEVVATHVW